MSWIPVAQHPGMFVWYSRFIPQVTKVSFCSNPSTNDAPTAPFFSNIGIAVGVRVGVGVRVLVGVLVAVGAVLVIANSRCFVDAAAYFTPDVFVPSAEDAWTIHFTNQTTVILFPVIVQTAGVVDVYVTGNPEFVTAAGVISLPSHSRHSGNVGKSMVLVASFASNVLVTVAGAYATPPKVPPAAVTVMEQVPTSSKFTRPLVDTAQIPGVVVVYVNAEPVAGAIVAVRG